MERIANALVGVVSHVPSSKETATSTRLTTLELRARPVADCIHREIGEATRCDCGRKDADRALDIGLEAAHHVGGEPATDDHYAEFRVQRERAWIEVDRADEQELAVGDDRLGVHHRRLILIDADPVLDETWPTVAAGALDDPLVVVG